MKNTKQIIVLRKFPNLRTGKYASQAAHASMAFLTKHGKMDYIRHSHPLGLVTYQQNKDHFFITKIGDMHDHHEAIAHWLSNSFRKIVCYVETEEELQQLHKNAAEKGLMSHLVEDNGATEFGGVKTTTALAIGPHWDDDFVGVTDHLKLF